MSKTEDIDDNPSAVHGVAVYPKGYEKDCYRCHRCGLGLSAITGSPGVEVCRRCAILYATHELTFGCTFHVVDIKWEGPYIFYQDAKYIWHPQDKDDCRECQMMARRPMFMIRGQD